ncbi:MAG: hypothetical protein E6J71_14035 [Deltaproteobacteria bacterium]|nr:MAG: hypothetical protein E6J81_14415 [Deltaproteobacteria bacterium]TMA86269.1 MAG: hypothetical protein E6J77_11145 [Deltaproteobacteria bacterium]TMB17759.1 MAG: hypothetical protein E6J71_14035 [Deltaproteobacteria bacterium]
MSEPAQRGPGPVAAVHRILIVAALLCALAYAAWEASEYRRTAEGGALVRCGVALLATAGIGLYLRSLRGLADRLTAREEEKP